MRIAFEARALNRPASGIRTYVRHLLDALAANSEISLKTLDKGFGADALWPWWLNTSVPHWLDVVKPDLVHFTKAAVPRRKQYPTVVTIYDVIPLLYPESQKFLPRLLWPATLRHAARSADHIITISQASKKDIVERLQVAPERVTVTPLAVETKFIWRNSKLAVDWQAPYILYLGTIEPRKNIPALVRAFAQIAGDIPHQLVIAGRHYKAADRIYKVARDIKISERVKLLKFVPEQDLPRLYANAALFVLPSIYEGWGFPAQQAMAAGVPVIVSNGGSLPEVVGDAGEVVAFAVDNIPDRPEDAVFTTALADRIKAILTNPAKQAKMRQRGLARVRNNDWETVARITLEVYRRVI